MCKGNNQNSNPASSTSEFFPLLPLCCGEKLVLSQVRESQGPGYLVWGGVGDGRQPKNEVKVERNEYKRLHALEFGQNSGFKGQRKELLPHGVV